MYVFRIYLLYTCENNIESWKVWIAIKLRKLNRTFYCNGNKIQCAQKDSTALSPVQFFLHQSNGEKKTPMKLQVGRSKDTYNFTFLSLLLPSKVPFRWDLPPSFRAIRLVDQGKRKRGGGGKRFVSVVRKREEIGGAWDGKNCIAYAVETFNVISWRRIQWGKFRCSFGTDWKLFNRVYVAIFQKYVCLYE